MWDFEHGPPRPDFTLSYTVPSQCAAQLAEGSADIGIIPAAAYATTPNLAVLPGIAIASRKKVRSILLVSKMPAAQIRSVALDTSSLSSVALTKILFAKHWCTAPAFTPMPSDLGVMLSACDAGLIIGDPALRIETTGLYTYDLAEEWVRMTDKSFVFAFWAIRREAFANLAPNLNLGEVFQRSRDHGLETANLARIAQEWAPRTALDEAAIKLYLTENIHYYLDHESLDGLALFYRYGHECGCLPQAPPLDFV
jgi:chorismate dehydratase